MYSPEREDLETLLSGGIHDLNNLLHVALALSNLLRHNLGATHPMRPQLLMVEQSLYRAALLGTKMRAFAMPGKRHRELVDAGALVRDALRILETRKPGLDFEICPAPGPVWVLGDVNELLEAMLDVLDWVVSLDSAITVGLEKRANSTREVLRLCVRAGGEAPSFSGSSDSGARRSS